MRTSFFITVTALSLLAAACEDPTKGKAKATTENVTQTAQATTAAAATGTAYKFDAASSKIGWVGSKALGSKQEGSIATFNGTIHLVDGAPEKNSVTAEIDPASITSESAKLAEHLKSADFFDVEKFTKVTFASTGIKAGGEQGASHTVTGNLTMHGVTKAIVFPATIKVSGDQVLVNAEFAVNRKDFGINYPGKSDDLIRDEVLVKLTIAAKK
ncbi:MAG: YceI family protein [Polyangiaceae bacterium]|nr:YceI family protein [Polyangiaceae bacterium]